MLKTIISFDCAIMHMGVTVIELNIPDLSILDFDLSQVGKHTKHIQRDLKLLQHAADTLDRVVSSLIKIVYVGKWSLTDSGADVDIHQLCCVLKPMLQKIEKQYTPTAMIYENQMVQNDKSRTVSHFLVYHFIDLPVYRVPPSYKNLVTLGRGIAYSDFAGRCTDRYDANKAHSVGTFEHWINVFHPPVVVPSGKKDDIADSFTQFLGLLKHCAENTTLFVEKIAKKKKPKKVKKIKHYDIEP